MKTNSEKKTAVRLFKISLRENKENERTKKVTTTLKLQENCLMFHGKGFLR